MNGSVLAGPRPSRLGYRRRGNLRRLGSDEARPGRIPGVDLNYGTTPAAIRKGSGR